MELHKAVGKQEAKCNDRTLYKMADTACKKFIMEVVNKMWYKEIEEPAMFYTNAPALKLLDHLNEFCLGLHTVNAVNIPQLMKTLFANGDRIPQFINVMEAAQKNSKRAKLPIQD